MRSIVLTVCLLLGMASSAMGQAIANSYRTGDIALTYHEVHTNAPPGGGCGCFYLSGGGLSGSYRMDSRLAIVAEFSVDHTSQALSSTKSLTLTSYMAGARYRLLRTNRGLDEGRRSFQPWAQVLVGGAHSGGGLTGVADGSNGFAGRLGAGVDWPLNPAISIRVAQVDYYLTDFSNTANNHQNNLLFGAGVALHWYR
jgi:outer membrane immunogenic protein